MKKYLKILFVSLYFVNLFINNALSSRFAPVEVEKEEVVLNKYLEILTVCNAKIGMSLLRYPQDQSGGDEMFKIGIDKEKALSVLIKYLKDDSIYVKNLAARCVNRLSYSEFEDTIKEVIEDLKKQEGKKVIYTYEGSPWDGIEITRKYLGYALYKINFDKIQDYKKKLEILEREFDTKQKQSEEFSCGWGYYQLGNIGEKASKDDRDKIIKLLEAEKRMLVHSIPVEENLIRLKALDGDGKGLIEILKGIKVSKADAEDGNQYLKICALNMIQELKMVEALPVIKSLLQNKIEKAKNGYKVDQIKRIMEGLKKHIKENQSKPEIRERDLKAAEEYYTKQIPQAIEDELLEMDGPFVKKSREVIKYLETLPKEEK